MTPMEFTTAARRALCFTIRMYKDAGAVPPSDMTEALAMLGPEPEAARPLLRIGPGGDFVKDWTPKG